MCSSDLAGAATNGRLQPGYLAAERRRKTGGQFANEFECAFVSPDRQVFEDAWLDESFSAAIPLFDECSRIDLRHAKHRPVYYLGLDLGTDRDHAALVLLEYRVIPTARRDAATYGYLYRRELRVVWIRQFRLMTDYHDMVACMSRLCAHPHLAGHTQLIYEINGPGRVVHDMLRRAELPVALVPITTTGGQFGTVKGARRTVPKAELVASLEILFRSSISRPLSRGAAGTATTFDTGLVEVRATLTLVSPAPPPSATPLSATYSSTSRIAPINTSSTPGPTRDTIPVS